MTTPTDAYSQWLGLAIGAKTPHYYELLGLPTFESEPPLIADAVDRQLARLRPYLSGPDAALAQQIRQQINSARATLLAPVAKREYDGELARQQASIPVSIPGPVVSAAVMSPPFATAVPVAPMGYSVAFPQAVATGYPQAAMMPNAWGNAAVMTATPLPNAGFPSAARPGAAPPVSQISRSRKATNGRISTEVFAVGALATVVVVLGAIVGLILFDRGSKTASDKSGDPDKETARVTLGGGVKSSPKSQNRPKPRRENTATDDASSNGVDESPVAADSQESNSADDSEGGLSGMTVDPNTAANMEGAMEDSSDMPAEKPGEKPGEMPEEKPAEKPADKPTETPPPGEKPNPDEPKPTDDKPAEDEKPAETRPTDDKPADEKPSSEMAMEEKPADDKPAENDADKPEEEGADPDAPDASEVFAVKKALAAAREAMADRKLADVQENLDQATLAASAPTLQADVERSKALLARVTTFWDAVSATLKSMKGKSDELQLGDKVISVIEAGDDWITYKESGKRRKFELAKIPWEIAIGLAEKSLKSGDAESKLSVAAFMLVEKRGGKARVRKLFDEAIALGVESPEIAAEIGIAPMSK